jgi:hypothetical protein
VELKWKKKKGVPVKVRGETEMVSALGALLRLATSAPPPAEVRIKNMQSRQTTTARVLYSVQPDEGEPARVAVALDVPGERFWRVPALRSS